LSGYFLKTCLSVMNSTAVVTIVSNNYLHFARTLMQSVAQQHPQADRYCVIVDRDLSHGEALAPEFQVLKLSQLSLPDGEDFLFQYTVLELNTAVKPWALAHLVRQGYQNVLYIDPDIALYRPLDDVLALLDNGSDLVLTPHLLTPISDTLQPSELDIRRAGTYNLGFCALRGGANMLAMLQWWQGKLRRDCVNAQDQGVFVDQSWMDLVPGLFSKVAVLRHPGYNVAYWNIAQRPMVLNEQGQVLVAGELLAFFHYSGLEPLKPHTVSKHQNRFTLDNVDPPLVDLINNYCQRVVTNGIAHYSAMDYSFGCFADGRRITNTERSRFRTSDALRALALGKPFSHRALLSIPLSLSGAGSAVEPAAEQELKRIYAHFLGRQPDESARNSFKRRSHSRLGQLQTLYLVGTSQEAKAQPGWLLRLLSWPLRHAQLHLPPPVVSALVAVPAVTGFAARPAPYGGLHGPEADCAENGLWVAARLDLPVCHMSAGRIQIKGRVDLALLRRGRLGRNFKLEIHGAYGLLHTATLTDSGPFEIDITVPEDSLGLTSQWTLMASAHVVPKTIGLSEDTRELAWRVMRVQVDDLVLVDSARSPATLAIEQLVPAGGINLIGYLAAELGVGEAARSLARACIAGDIPFSAIDVGFQSQNLQRDTTLLSHAVPARFAVDLLYVNADQTPTITRYLQEKGLQSRYRIGYWHWEQPQLPATVLGAFADVDEVWVPSTFVHDAVAPFAPVPVVKIPHAIAFEPSPGLTRSQFGLPQDKLLALVMYDFHSYQYRKNPQAALAAFRLAAAGRTNVALVIKTINGQHHAAARQALADSVADLGNVFFIDEFFTRQQTWDLQACCDILISLHRAEGFGLVPAEMMYLGKPVIATDWSANTDFMNPDNAMPVRYQLAPLAQAVGVYPAGQLWAEADVDHAAWCLTRLLDDPALGQQLGAQARADIRRQLSPQAVGALVHQRLSLLGFWHPMLRTVV
jgi:glycosyltransferase involved in cell wall biosynthesis